MKKKIARVLVLLLVISLWGFFLLFQHVACIADVFGDNPWHLYVLAILSACLQHLMLYIARKQSLPCGFFLLFGIVYIIALSYPTIDFLRYPVRLPGLIVLGLCLDAWNILLVFAWHRRRAG